jgi:hypothetical protein
VRPSTIATTGINCCPRRMRTGGLSFHGDVIVTMTIPIAHVKGVYITQRLVTNNDDDDDYDRDSNDANASVVAFTTRAINPHTIY